MNPRFSIITVCRNEEHSIGKTCESIVAQTHSDFEWLVIDGASTDGTLKALDPYRDRITHLVSEPDDGIFDAMNKGIASARGEYLVFMNGGDCFASDKALEWVSAETTADLIYGDTYHDSSNERLVTYPDQLPKGYFLNNTLPHQATYYHRSLFDKHGTYDTSYRIAGDYDLHVRLFEVAGVSHHHVAKPLAVFSLTGISTNPAWRDLRKRENHRVRLRYFPAYRWSPKAWRQAIRNALGKG